MLRHRRRALLAAAALLACFAVLDVVNRSAVGMIARVVWVAMLVGVALAQDPAHRRRADWLARLVGLLSGVAATAVVASTGGSHSLNFGFLYAIPFCALVLVPDLPSAAAIAGVAASVGGAVLLVRDGQPAREIALWVFRSASIAGIAGWGTMLYRRLLVNELSAQRDRSEALTRLAQSEALFRDLAERAIVGVYVVRNGVMEYVNPRFAEIFGYPRDELIGTPHLALIHPDERAAVAERVRLRLEGRSPALHFELRGLRKGGEVIELEAFGSRTVYGAEPAIIGTLLDVTNRKRADEERVRIQKLESVGVLAGGDRARLQQPAGGHHGQPLARAGARARDGPAPGAARGRPGRRAPGARSHRAAPHVRTRRRPRPEARPAGRPAALLRVLRRPRLVRRL